MMDWFMVALVICAAVLPFLLLSASTDNRRPIEIAGKILGAIGCLLMLSWMWFADGAHSRVWNWLPPFWPWGRFLTGTASRRGLVLLLVLGTILGLLSEWFTR